MAGSPRLAIIIIVLVAGVAAGQSFNLSLAPASATPPSAAHAAAGLPGHWNQITGLPWGQHFPLDGLDAASTPVTVRNLGGNGTQSIDNPATAGDDGALMDTYLATFDQIETCLRFFNLVNGTYVVRTYAWHPSQPGLSSWVTCDESTTGGLTCGGGWPGGYTLGVTHVEHVAVVVNGQLNVHSAFLTPFQGVAPLNGVQLQLIQPSDGDVGLGAGGPFDLLTMNGTAGGAARTVSVGLAAPMTLSVAQPPTSAVPSAFALFGMIGAPTAADVTVLPFGLGDMAFAPCPLTPEVAGLFVVANGFGADPCGAIVAATPTPWAFVHPGVGFPVTFALQGIVEESPAVLTVFNALTVVVQ